MSVSSYSLGQAFQKEVNNDVVDAITSKDSTFPYDVDTMHRMMRLVQEAKGTQMCCKEEREHLLYNSDAKGGLAYYAAGVSEYMTHARCSLTDLFSSAPSVVFW